MQLCVIGISPYRRAIIPRGRMNIMKTKRPSSKPCNTPDNNEKLRT